VREYEQPRPGLGRDPACLASGQVPELPGQRRVRVGEGGLAHQHVGPLGERERAITEPGIHDEREPLARPELAHLLDRHEAVPREQAAVTLQPADVWSGNPRCCELVRQHPSAVRLGQRVAEGRHAVRELPGFQAERPLPPTGPSTSTGRSSKETDSR
jgi:hypothetical protein